MQNPWGGHTGGPPTSSPGRCQTPPPPSPYGALSPLVTARLSPPRCAGTGGPAPSPGCTSPSRGRGEPRARSRSTQQPAPTPRHGRPRPGRGSAGQTRAGASPRARRSPRNAIKSSAPPAARCQEPGAGGRGTRPHGGLWRGRRQAVRTGTGEGPRSRGEGRSRAVGPLPGQGDEGLCGNRHPARPGLAEPVSRALRPCGVAARERSQSRAETPSGSPGPPGMSRALALPPQAAAACHRPAALSGSGALSLAESENKPRKISGERNTVAVIYLYFSTKFDTVFHKTLLKNIIQTR